MLKLNQYSTQRGIILVIGALISLAFEWFGKSSSQVIPIMMLIFTQMTAGLHGATTDDTKQEPTVEEPKQ
jgi:hypothetical protein